MTQHNTTSQDPLWYKDAVVYQLHIKSFFDSDNDGVGDFKGLLAKLDYIAELGVTAVWLLPFYPSPRRDDGYDRQHLPVSPHVTSPLPRARLRTVLILRPHGTPAASFDCERTQTV